MALNQIGLERLNTATTKKIGTNKNIIINGAMQVAQRGTSSTAVGYKTVDRIYGGYAGTDEAPTFTQADIGTSDAPYLSGFRKSFKIQNGNQTSGAGAADELFMTYNIEAQDLAQSGWDYTSSSSNITLSFWVKSSVAQQFQVNMRLYPASGDQKEFCFEYTPSANTWTKVTKTIPGASGNVLRNTNELGMFIQFPQFYGTNYTANTRAFDTWETKNNAQNYKDYATTWYTTNDATWEITGLQLEVGSVATDFEHKSFTQDLALCQRYFETSHSYGVYPFTDDSKGRFIQSSSSNGAGNCMQFIYYATPKRAPATITGAPCVSGNTTLGEWGYGRNGGGGTSSVTFDESGTSGFRAYNGVGANHVVCDTYGHWKAEAEL